MDNNIILDKEKVYAKNENSNQIIKILVYDALFILSSIVITLLLHTVNFVVDLINIINNNIFSIITLTAIAVIFYFVFKFVKKFPFIKTKNYLLFCLPVIILFVALVWVLFFILYLKDVKNGFFIPNVDNFAILNNINKGWKIIPIIYTTVSLGILAISAFFTKRCPFCQKSGLGIASKRIYTITKITREHVETKKIPIYPEEEIVENVNENTAEEGAQETKKTKKKKVKPIDYSYTVYYQDFEYRIYRHYCSICGRILFEENAKVKIGKKHLNADFTEEEIKNNNTKINEHNEDFNSKEENLLSKINREKNKKTPIGTDETAQPETTIESIENTENN